MKESERSEVLLCRVAKRSGPVFGSYPQSRGANYVFFYMFLITCLSDPFQRVVGDLFQRMKNSGVTRFSVC